MVELITPFMTLLSGGTVVYLVIDKLFSRKKDNALAHTSEVESFDKEMSVIRKIHLEFLDDVNKARESLKSESAEETEKMSVEIVGLRSQISELKSQLVEEQKITRKIEGQYLDHLAQMNETVQNQSQQITRMSAFLHLLCDKECDERHTPNCPIA